MFDPTVIFNIYMEISELRKKWLAKEIKKEMSKEQFERYLTNKYESQFEPKSKLLDKIVDGSLDNNPSELNRFLKMIDRLQEIKDGKITKEEQDKKIGREYADEFVQPLVNKLDSKKS